MISVEFVAFDGTSHVLETAPEGSVMQLAVAHGISGIDGDCGGAMACGSCQIYLDPEWLARTGSPSELEKCLLEVSTNTRANTRLACQIVLSEELNGLVVRTPERQNF